MSRAHTNLSKSGCVFSVSTNFPCDDSIDTLPYRGISIWLVCPRRSLQSRSRLDSCKNQSVSLRPTREPRQLMPSLHHDASRHSDNMDAEQQADCVTQIRQSRIISFSIIVVIICPIPYRTIHLRKTNALTLTIRRPQNKSDLSPIMVFPR